MTALTPEERAAIQDRADAATAGPWVPLTTGVRGGDHWYVCGGSGSLAWIAADDGINEEQREPDAKFIAHARTDVPRLLAALDDAETRAATDRAERDRLRAQVERVRRLARVPEDRDHMMLCGRYGGGGCFRPSCGCWCHANPAGVVPTDSIRAALDGKG